MIFLYGDRVVVVTTEVAVQRGRPLPDRQRPKQLVVLPGGDALLSHSAVLEEAVTGESVLEHVDLSGPLEGALVGGLD